LTIRYLRPTPLGTELRFDVQRARIDGRRVVTRATLAAGEVVTAEGQGLFVVPEPGTWRAPAR
jgi:acyl-CoA thioesterase FadM